MNDDGFWAFVAWTAIVLILSSWGGNMKGEKTVQKEAVAAGVGHYIVDQATGKASFEFINPVREKTNE